KDRWLARGALGPARWLRRRALAGPQVGAVHHAHDGSTGAPANRGRRTAIAAAVRLYFLRRCVVVSGWGADLVQWPPVRPRAEGVRDVAQGRRPPAGDAGEHVGVVDLAGRLQVGRDLSRGRDLVVARGRGSAGPRTRLA